MIETVVIPVRCCGERPVRTGDVFCMAYDCRWEGDPGDLRKYENPPIIENETECDLFVEAIDCYGRWIDELSSGVTAALHLVGDDAVAITATRDSLRTQDRERRVCIGGTVNGG